MKRGKFEAQRPAPQQLELKQAKIRRLPRWLRITVSVLLLVILGGLQIYWFLTPAPASSVPGGLTKEEAMAQYQSMAQDLEQKEMNLFLLPDNPASQDVPIRIALSPARSQVCVDLAGLEQDLVEGLGKVARGRYIVDPAHYISLNHSVLRQVAEETARDWSQPYLPSFAEVSTHRQGAQLTHVLTVNIGMAGREISAEAIYQKLLQAYYSGDMEPTLYYETHIPDQLDIDAICTQFHTEPVDAVLDATSFAITPHIPGLGVDPQELGQLLEYALAGRGYTIPLRTLSPAVTTADMEDFLYGNILAEAHTPHTWVDDRTKNLMLACEKINGTILMPGETFSFNQTVGERTREGGYREATAYVAGESVPEIGGGVCQVASSIYYATLQADLPAVERHAHTYLVTYVPQGMDAAIYWNQLDFQFKNISPYPIKIDADVSDGAVHILLRGRDWKDYTVELSYDILSETPWKTVYRYVFDNSYEDGETIVTPYTGCRVATYKAIYDLDGKLIDTKEIAISNYSTRDEVIALRRYPPTPSESTPDD